MKREIKFRAQAIHNGEWVYGYVRHYAANPHTEKWTIYDATTGIETDIDEDTIGQFTGLLDKNKKEIYEGDTVRWKEKGFFDVLYDSFYSCFCVKMLNSTEWYYFSDFLREPEAHEMEVIGNQYEEEE